MSIKEKIKKAAPDIKKGIKSYPVTFVFSVITAVIVIMLTENKGTNISLQDALERILRILIIGIPLSMCISFITLQIKNKKFNAALWLIFILSLLGCFFWFYDIKDRSNIIRIAVIVVMSAAIYVSLPDLFKKRKAEIYASQLLSDGITAAFYTHLFYGGVAFILASMRILFSIHFKKEIYIETYAVCIGVVFSAVFLSLTCKNKENTLPKVFEKITKYILIPILSVYTLMLYVYFATILLKGKIPENMIGNLVLWYSIIGTITVIIMNSLVEDKKGTELFRKFYPILSIFPILVMFYSLFVRIKAYGITESRYFAVAAGIWVFILQLLFILGKIKNRKTVIAPLVFAAVAFLSISTPFSATRMSIKSQSMQLKKLFYNNNLILNGKIIKNKNISREDISRISNIINYFHSMHRIEDINFLPKGVSYKDLMDVIGIKRLYPFKEDFIHMMAEQTDKLLNIKGYDYMMDHIGFLKEVKLDSGVSIRYDNKNVLSIYKDSALIYSKDIDKLVEIIYLQNIDKVDYNNSINLDINAAEIIDENKYFKIKYIIRNANIRLINNEPEVLDMDFILMLKEKI